MTHILSRFAVEDPRINVDRAKSHQKIVGHDKDASVTLTMGPVRNNGRHVHGGPNSS